MRFAIWPICQSFIVLYILYGMNLFLYFQKTALKLSEYLNFDITILMYLIGLLFTFKCIIALVIPFYSKNESVLYSRFIRWCSRHQKSKKHRNKYFSVFIIIYIVYIAILFYSETNYNKIIFNILRPIGIMLIFNYIFTRLKPIGLINKIPNKHFVGRLKTILSNRKKM